MTQIISSLDEVALNYDVLFCDLWGCLHNGKQPFPAAVAALQAFRRGGGDGKPIYFKMDLCWARSEEEALRQAHEQWRFNILGGSVNWDLRTPAEFEAAARFVRPEDCRDAIHVSSDLGRLAGWLAEYAEIGFAGIDLHNVGTDQEAFVDAFGERGYPTMGLPAETDVVVVVDLLGVYS